jgi:hypothetical protein
MTKRKTTDSVTAQVQRLVSWVWFPKQEEWRLVVAGRKCHAATVWDNGVWHTWDERGGGGENSQEASIDEAKRQAGGSAILQGFVNS